MRKVIFEKTLYGQSSSEKKLYKKIIKEEIIPLKREVSKLKEEVSKLKEKTSEEKLNKMILKNMKYIFKYFKKEL